MSASRGCLEPELLQPSLLYLVGQVALSGQGEGWPEGMSERCLVVGGCRYSCRQMPRCSCCSWIHHWWLWFCFGEGRGGRAWRRGRVLRTAPPLSLLSFYFEVFPVALLPLKSGKLWILRAKVAFPGLSGCGIGNLPRLHLGLHHPVTMSAADAMLHNGSLKYYNPGCCNAVQLQNQTPTRPQGMAELPPGWPRGFGGGDGNSRVAEEWVSDPESDNLWRGG